MKLTDYIVITNYGKCNAPIFMCSSWYSNKYPATKITTCNHIKDKGGKK